MLQYENLIFLTILLKFTVALLVGIKVVRG